MGSAPSSTPVAAARFEIAASTRTADGTRSCTMRGRSASSGMRLSRIAAQAIFGMSPAEWLGIADVGALRAWCAAPRDPPAILLGQVLADEPAAAGSSGRRSCHRRRPDALLHVIVPSLRDDPAFARAPTWAGAPVETGALARMRDEPLVAAVHADNSATPSSPGSLRVSRNSRC